MDTKELNEYIKNYLLNDKTQRAIMLTAPWGSGKSYYIKNDLCPFLLENDLGFAVVSLYGLKEIKEVSKSLYLEVRAKKLNEKSEKLATGKIIGKTLLKGVASFFGVDLRQSEEDLQNLYESIDLSKKLIIFEDLERTSLDIVEFLGYVNNLTEHDGVNVLIVANENALINKIEVVKDKKDYSVQEYVLDEKSQQYLTQKEKTIGDTIHFTGSSLDIIEGIYSLFNNKFFKSMINYENEFTKDNIYQKIQDVMQLAKCDNYRSLLYACQKTEEIFNKLEKSDYDIYYLQNVLLGTVAYCVNGQCANNSEWNEVSFTSTTLGMTAFPLHKFMYDYIKFQYFKVSDFDFSYELFNKAKEQEEKDKHLSIIYKYYTFKESDIDYAINNILNGLAEDKGLIHNEYIKLANYLISIKYNIGFKTKINKCLKHMLKNVEKDVQKGEDVQTYSSFGIQPLSQEELAEFNNFKDKMLKIVSEQQNSLQFDYKPQSIRDYHTNILKNKRTFINEGGFANKLDTEKTIKMLKQCTPNQIEEFRNILKYIYVGISNIAHFMSGDAKNLQVIKDSLDELLKDAKSFDKVQLLQLKWLSGNLEEIIKKLKGGQNVKTKRI